MFIYIIAIIKSYFVTKSLILYTTSFYITPVEKKKRQVKRKHLWCIINMQLQKEVIFIHKTAKLWKMCYQIARCKMKGGGQEIWW